MQVDPKLAAGRISSTAARRPASSGAAFSPDARETGAPRTASLSATAAPASLDALIALQVGEDPRERRRRSVRHGQELLDELDRLKAALLAGRVPAADLKRLAGRLGQRPELSGDPRLDDLVAQIELRALVELAKLRRG